MTAQATPPPFSDPQWSQLRQWLETLDERQRWWLSGYLAAANSAPAAVAGTEGTQPVLIGYGTETDNCRHLARTLSEHCGDAGIATEVVDLARLRPRQLARRDHLVIITATHGDGDPPEPIQDFYQGLMGDGAPQLANLKFAVLALGDSSYERFCVTGQEFDQRLEALGGERLIARQDCDVDFEQPARDWIARLLEKLPKANTTDTAQGPARAPTSSPPSYDKHHPLTVEVLVNQNLSAADRAQPIHHLELALDQAIPDLFPGDAVGILADNPPELVAAVLDACELSGEQPVTVNDDAQPLVQALRQTRDLTIAGTSFLAFWAEQSQAPALLELCQAESRRQRAFLRDHQLLDLLHQYPARPPAQALVEALRPLQPRLYDVANSLAVLDDELHLTVKAFHYPFRERHEQGIASRYLLDLQPGDPVRLYPHRNARFRLPDDDAPLILIAEGTGIAPYRAFLQALSQQSQRPPCWLVFAEQRFEDDFLYQLDIQQARADGVLERVDTVFYQDQPGAGLITPLLDQIDRLGTWIDRGAHLYLCGDKGRLSDLESGLKTALDQRQGDGAWKQLGREKRLHRNLY